MSEKDIIAATKCVMEGMKHTNDTIDSLFTKVSGMCRAIGHSNECAKDARHKARTSMIMKQYLPPIVCLQSSLLL